MSILFSYIELFEQPVEYNSDKIPENKLENNFDKESVILTELFNKIKIKEIPSDYKNIFKNISNYDTFVISDEFNKKIKDIFTNGINIVKESYNIYYIDKNNNREYVFNINISNKKFNTIRILKIYLQINNIQNYLTDTGELYPSNLIDLRNDLQINCIILDDLIKDDNVNIHSIQEYNNYYRIPSVSSDEMMITDTMKIEFEKMLEKRQLSEQKDIIFKEGSCFDDNNNIINQNRDECVGLWDTIPKTSEECPYYDSNQNYPNDFGKVVDNYCELPNNMKNVGYRNYSKDPQFLPLCYNCNKEKRLFANRTLGFCCDDQKDKTLYKNLLTPDYAFKHDEELREKYKDALSIMNLSYN